MPACENAQKAAEAFWNDLFNFVHKLANGISRGFHWDQRWVLPTIPKTRTSVWDSIRAMHSEASRPRDHHHHGHNDSSMDLGRFAYNDAADLRAKSSNRCYKHRVACLTCASSANRSRQRRVDEGREQDEICERHRHLRPESRKRERSPEMVGRRDPYYLHGPPAHMTKEAR